MDQPKTHAEVGQQHRRARQLAVELGINPDQVRPDSLHAVYRAGSRTVTVKWEGKLVLGVDQLAAAVAEAEKAS